MRNGHLETAKELGRSGAEFMAGLAGLDAPTEPACPRPQWPESVWEMELEGQIKQRHLRLAIRRKNLLTEEQQETLDDLRG